MIRKYSDSTSNQIKYLKKTRKSDHYSREYPLTTSLSIEKEVNLLEWKSGSTTKRTKIRHSFFLGDFRLDFTKAVTTINKNDTTSYEVELEVINLDILYKSNYDRIIDGAVYDVMRVLYSTTYIYTIQDFFDVISSYNSVGLKDPKRSDLVMDARIMERPRNLHIDDLVRGGIFDNPKGVFMVHHKIDGERRFLLFVNESVWLVHPPSGLINRVTTPTPPASLKRWLTVLNGTVLDGELIKVSELKNLDDIRSAKYENYTEIFYVFDVLRISDTLLTDVPFVSKTWVPGKGAGRYNPEFVDQLNIFFYNLSKTASNTKIMISKIVMKSLIKNKRQDYAGNKIGNDFFVTIQNMIESQIDLDYETDGLIFQPVGKHYVPVTGDLKTRTLKNKLEICKWKPVMTIDLLVRRHNRNLTVMCNTKDGLKSFSEVTTNDKYQFFDNLIGNFDEDPNEKIYEFFWDADNYLLVPQRLRRDKLKPNGEFVARDNWLLNAGTHFIGHIDWQERHVL
jgi:hypothetical protein